MAVTGNNNNQNKTLTTARTNTTSSTAQQVPTSYTGSSNANAGTYYRPEGYSSKYTAALDDVMNQIKNYGEFSYEFNGDNLFKAYSDLYTQQGKQASLDAQGQAAELTGGYGNSYGQQVGQQTYNSYLTSLYDKGLDLRDTAYDTWSDQRQDLYNQYTNLYNAEAEDYARYEAERTFKEEQRQYDISVAKDYCTQILENGGMPSEELLAMAGLTKEDAEEMRNKENDPQNGGEESNGSGGSGGGGGSGKTTYYVNQNLDGSYTYLKKNSDGSLSKVTESEAKNGNINTTLIDNANDNSNMANAVGKTVGNVVTKGTKNSSDTTKTAAAAKTISNAASSVGSSAGSNTTAYNFDDALKNAKNKGWEINK